MDLDLTDTWQGRYSFPRLYRPVSFVAVLRQAGEWIEGKTEEVAERGPLKGSAIAATLSGRLTGSEVSFLKTYDNNTRPYDAVQYQGSVSSDGLEISGVWSIHGNWSGTFLMIRSGGLTAAVSREALEPIEVR